MNSMHLQPRFTTLFLALALLAPRLAGAGEAATRPPGSERPGANEQQAIDPERAPVPPPIEVGFSGSTLVVEPRVTGVATSVYLSCADGTYLHRELEGVGTALVELVREDGAAVADGRCKYEVYVHPPVDEEAMRAAEKKRDLAMLERLSRLEEEQTVIVHGLFRVAGGAAVAGWSGGADE